MSRVPAAAFAIMALGPLMTGVSPGHAALDIEAAAVTSSGLELLVVEADACRYCDLFRQEIAATYEGSERAKSVPMRFADVGDVMEEGVELDAPIDSVPTVVLLKNGHEAGRLAGYLGRENFFLLINSLISGAE